MQIRASPLVAQSSTGWKGTAPQCDSSAIGVIVTEKSSSCATTDGGGRARGKGRERSLRGGRVKAASRLQHRTGGDQGFIHSVRPVEKDLPSPRTHPNPHPLPPIAAVPPTHPPISHRTTHHATLAPRRRVYTTLGVTTRPGDWALPHRNFSYKLNQTEKKQGDATWRPSTNEFGK